MGIAIVIGAAFICRFNSKFPGGLPPAVARNKVLAASKEPLRIHAQELVRAAGQTVP